LNTERKYLGPVQWVLLITPFLYNIYFVNKYAVNLPSLDDYGAILNFLNNYKTSSGWSKFILLFSQHNEHRILSSRIIYVLYYSLFHTINFRHIIILGNIQLLAAFCIFALFIKRAIPKFWFPGALFAAVNLFDFSNWENADFAMAAIQNYGIILLVSLTILFYHKTAEKYLYLAALFQFLCVFSSGNGIVAAAIITLFNFLSATRKKAFISLGIFLACTTVYFIGYVSPETGHPAHNIPKILSYFFTTCSAIAIIDNATACIVVGVILIGIFMAAFPIDNRLKIKPGFAPLACLSFFVLASMGMMAVFRCNVTGVPANSSRYTIYPHYLYALIFVFLLHKIKNMKVLIAAAIIFTTGLVMAYRKNLVWGMDNFKGLQHNLTTNQYFFPDKQTAKAITDKSCELNIYCIEQHR